MELYQTIAARHSAEIVEKKSRFIALTAPVSSASDAEALLAEVSLTHKGASHHCYGWRIGVANPVLEKLSDAGEPSGTAGRPIIDVLRRQNLRQVLVVVTRYFGGTLLGANGLVRAYAQATAEVLQSATRLTCYPMSRLTIHADYSHYGKLEFVLAQHAYEMIDKTFEADVTFALDVKVEDVDAVRQLLTDACGGQIAIDVQPPRYVGVDAAGAFYYDV